MAWTPTATPGTQFKINAGGWKLLEGLIGLSGPGGSKPLTSVTALSDLAMKFKAGRPDYGKVSGECVFDPIDVSQLKLLTAFAAVPAVAVAFEVGSTEHGGKAVQFSAMVDELGLSFPNEGPAMLKWGASLTTGRTLATATAVTPSATFNSCVGQGTVLELWVEDEYVPILGVSMVEISGVSRAKIPATQISALTPTFLVGIPNNGKAGFDLMFDSTDANHALLLAAFDAPNQTDRLRITMTDPAASKIILNPVLVDTFEFALGQQDSVNLVKAGATINCPIAVTA